MALTSFRMKFGFFGFIFEAVWAQRNRETKPIRKWYVVKFNSGTMLSHISTTANPLFRSAKIQMDLVRMNTAVGLLYRQEQASPRSNRLKWSLAIYQPLTDADWGSDDGGGEDVPDSKPDNVRFYVTRYWSLMRKIFSTTATAATALHHYVLACIRPRKYRAQKVVSTLSPPLSYVVC